MADDIDRAKDNEMLSEQVAMQNHADRARQTESPEYMNGVQVCIDCLDPITTARLAAVKNCVRCVWCEEDNERRKRRQHAGR